MPAAGTAPSPIAMPGWKGPTGVAGVAGTGEHYQRLVRRSRFQGRAELVLRTIGQVIMQCDIVRDP